MSTDVGVCRAACLTLRDMSDEPSTQGDGEAGGDAAVQLLGFLPQPDGGFEGEGGAAAAHRLDHALAAAQRVNAFLLTRRGPAAGRLLGY